MHKNAIWNRTPPPTHQMQSICMWEVSRVPNLQTEFNYLDLLKSYGIFSDFVVPTSSLCRPHCPHVILIAPRRSPCGPHGCGLRSLCGLHLMLCPLSPWSPRCPRCPHIIPIIPMSSPHHLEGPHIISNPPDTHST